MKDYEEYQDNYLKEKHSILVAKEMFARRQKVFHTIRD